MVKWKFRLPMNWNDSIGSSCYSCLVGHRNWSQIKQLWACYTSVIVSLFSSLYLGCSRLMVKPHFILEENKTTPASSGTQVKKSSAGRKLRSTKQTHSIIETWRAEQGGGLFHFHAVNTHVEPALVNLGIYWCDRALQDRSSVLPHRQSGRQVANLPIYRS